MIAFVEDVTGWRVCDHLRTSTRSNDGGAGIFTDAEFGERFAVRSRSHFDFERIKAHFGVNRKFLDGPAAKHFVAALADTEDLPIDRRGTITETSENTADDLERGFEFLCDHGVGA